MVRPRIYIAGPYTKPDPVLNVREAIRVADQLLDLGCAPFIPHLTHLWHLVSPKLYEEWLAIDLEWVRACHALLRIPGESSGADREVEFAVSISMPVYCSVGQLVDELSSLKKVLGAG